MYHDSKVLEVSLEDEFQEKCRYKVHMNGLSEFPKRAAVKDRIIIAELSS